MVPCMFCNCDNTIYVSSQINLSYCSVTDIGLLSLSSISGLQNMTIVHLAGITPNGVTATLMVCGCLTKVKLHEAFKSMMPPHMIKKILRHEGVFSSGSINHLRYCIAPLVALHSVKPLRPSRIGVLPDLLLENTT